MRSDRLLAAFLVAGAGCARHTTATALPRAAAPDSSTALAGLVVTIADSADYPRVSWGSPPAPPGERHAPRERGFDLRHQVVRLRFDWKRRAVVGSTELHVAARDRAVTAIDLDAVGIDVRSVRGVDGRALRVRVDARSLAVLLSAALAPGDSTTIAIDYETVRPGSGAWFVDGRHVAWAQGKFEDARFWVPTDDRPAAKPTWELLVRAESGERAYATGRLAGSRPLESGAAEWRWIVDRPTPAFLLAVVVGPYERVEEHAGPVTLGYWAYHDSLSAARRGFASTPRAIEYMARRLGVPFPGTSFEQAIVPGYVFWSWLNSHEAYVTAAVVDEQQVLGTDERWVRRRTEETLAKAAAQQWFGRLVTPADWSHLWLNEGVASFLAQTWLEEATDHSATAFGEQERSLRMGAVREDRASRRPLVYDRWVYAPDELLRSPPYAGSRGAAVLRMLRRQIGDDAFWRGMHRFLVDHADRSATTADLQRAFESASGRKLDVFFRQWVYGAGRPLLRVTSRSDSAARRIVVTARQLQERDETTGFFAADVDVQVMTDAGVVDAVVPLEAREVTEHAIALAATPRALRWDPDGLLLSAVDLQVPTEWLVYQLRHAPDARGKVEAARELDSRAIFGGGHHTSAIVSAGSEPPLAEPDAMEALLTALRTDPSPLTRAAAARALNPDFGESIERALIVASHDADVRVRASAMGSLIGNPGALRIPRLREMAASDPDTTLRRAAAEGLEFMTPMAKLRGMAVGPSANEPPPPRETKSDDEALRVLVAASLSADVAKNWDTAKYFLTTPGFDRRVRQAAMRALGMAVMMSRSPIGGGAEASADELVTLLTPFLGDADPTTRLAAAREISFANGSAAVAALEGRKRVEADPRVLAQIDESLRQMAKKDPFSRHR